MIFKGCMKCVVISLKSMKIVCVVCVCACVCAPILPLAMTARPLWRALCLLALLCTWSRTSSADTQPDPSAAEQEVTLSHIYKIDIPGSTSCNLQHISTQDETGHKKDTTERLRVKSNR